ncbi:PAS domain S-box protein [bacterium]|nr:PAS domain S-box protein [bacterium]
MHRFLAIDDREDNLISLQAILKNVRPEDEIITAMSGVEGIEKAVRLRPDLILLDISMPAMDGFEVCSLLKSKPETMYIPIILLTAYHTDSKSRVYGLEQGAEAFLSKPIDEGELIAQINAMLRLKVAEESLRVENRQLENRVRERTRALEKSRRQYQFLFDFAPDIYCTLDDENRIVAANQFGASYLGYQKEELQGKEFLTLIHQDDRKAAQRIVASSRNQGVPSNTEPFRLMRKDGSFLWVSLRANAPELLHESESNVLLILHDVTEEQEVLAALHQSEMELRTLYNNLSVGIYRSTRDGQIVFANPALLEMLKCDSLEELQSGNLPEQFAYNRTEFERIMTRYKAVSGYETRIRRHDGSWIDVRENAVIVPDEDGEIQYYEGTLEDITHKVKAERDLMVSERRFRVLAETAKDAILGFDRDGGLLIWNSAAASMFFLDSELHMGTACKGLIADLDSDQLLAIAQDRKEESSRSQVVERICRRTDGSEFPADLTLSEIESFDRVRVFAVVRDITERKKHEREREETLRFAQEALRVKSLFIANMSHEIRTPLNSLLGFTSLLEDSLADHLSEEQKEYFHIVEESGSRLFKTVHHILDLSHIESGGLTAHFEQFSLAEVVKNINREMQAAFLEKGLTSVLMIEDDPLMIEADHYMVSQTLTNILENAIKYSERGGIIIRAGVVEQEIHVSVKDNGVGISEDFLPYVFTEFAQESQGYTKKYQGLGLGLALAKRYVELNNGRIEVESEKNKGSKFTLVFPALSEHTAVSSINGKENAS